jgi:hypothetical protein
VTRRIAIILHARNPRARKGGSMPERDERSTCSRDRTASRYDYPPNPLLHCPITTTVAVPNCLSRSSTSVSKPSTCTPSCRYVGPSPTTTGIELGVSTCHKRSIFSVAAHLLTSVIPQLLPPATTTLRSTPCHLMDPCRPRFSLLPDFVPILAFDPPHFTPTNATLCPIFLGPTVIDFVNEWTFLEA